jgi:hypothetical protein
MILTIEAIYHRRLRCVLPLLGVLLYPAFAQAGSSCDFVLHWDEQTIAACVKEMKSDNWTLGMRVQNLETENHLLRSQLCTIAEELKRMGSSSELTSLVIEDACADPRAAAKRKLTGGPKPPKP